MINFIALVKLQFTGELLFFNRQK